MPWGRMTDTNPHGAMLGQPHLEKHLATDLATASRPGERMIYPASGTKRTSTHTPADSGPIAGTDKVVAVTRWNFLMHPDKKIGMALGILLVGIVGAFFFRNDTDATRHTAPRQLSSADALDEQIRQGDRVPYLPDRTNAPDIVPNVNIAELIEGIADVPDIPLPNPVSIPDPIRIDGAESTGQIVTPAAEVSDGIHGIFHPTVSSASGIGVPSATGAVTGSSAVTGWTIHEVGAGETLSGLASKYLGTHRRYRELFNANREILTSPDALRVGMKLKVPDRKTKPVPAPAADVSPATTSETPRLPRPDTSPVESKSGETLSPGRPAFVRPPGRVPRISANPSRSVGQQPPPGVPHVEGLDSVRNRRRIESKSARRDSLSDDPSGTRSR